MPNMEKRQKFWESLSVEERWAEVQKRPVSPEMARMIEDGQKMLNSRPRADLVPHFVEAFKSMREESRHGTQEERGVARACMHTIEKSARQQLSRRNFARFKLAIKDR